MTNVETTERSSVAIDFDRPGVPINALLLQPLVFQTGDRFVCQYGQNDAEPITGHGETPEQAMQDWDRQLQQRINSPKPGDALASDIVQKLNDKKGIAPGRETPVQREFRQTTEHAAGPAKEITDDASWEQRRKYTTDQNNTDGSE